jgi:hypothetical protein
VDEESLMEVTVPVGGETFHDEMKKLLSQKDKLVGQDAGDGRNQYQIKINDLKNKIKEYNKSQAKKDGVPKVKFSQLLNSVKKQEREGKFDRGAEGKAKNKLRKKMAAKAEKTFTAGRHKGSEVDKEIKEGMKGATSEEEVKVAKRLTGTKEKKKSIAKSR